MQTFPRTLQSGIHLQRGCLVYPTTHSKGLGSKAQARTDETCSQNRGHVWQDVESETSG